MKIKKFLPAMVFFAVTLVVYIAASIFFCYTTKPEITTGEFPFSITYEYKGEIKTMSGVYECVYSGSVTLHGEHERYWEGEAIYTNPDNLESPYIIDQSEEMQTLLSMQPNMYAGYLMGDPLHKDDYAMHGYDGMDPYIEYYDYKNDITLTEENKDEVLSSIGFKVIEFTYGEPIENSFSFSGIRYEADNLIIFAAISLVFLLLCICFVRKDKEYLYTPLDKIGVILNFLVGFIAVPFITLFCFLFGLVESDLELINQITYNTPSVAMLCLALSVVFRRKGISKTGFCIQFGGILLFILILVFDTVFLAF